MPETENIPEISVHYIGPAVENGRIDLFALSEGLRGLSRLTSRVSSILYGTTFEHRIELDESFRSGSIIIPLHVITDFIDQAESILLSKHVQALANLLTIMGFGIATGSVSLYKIFREKRGRPLTDADDLNRILASLENVERLLLIKVYNDLEVQSALRAVLRPLRTEGIVEFQTRRRNVIVDRVSHRDLKAADEAEEKSIQEIEEKVLDIEKVALVSHLAWHFSDQGKSFDARIQDPDLWARIAGGERFGYGDRMRVELRTSFFRDSKGRLNLERVIPKVIHVEHASQPQPPLFPHGNEDERFGKRS